MLQDGIMFRWLPQFYKSLKAAVNCKTDYERIFFYIYSVIIDFVLFDNFVHMHAATFLSQHPQMLHLRSSLCHLV